MCRVSTLELFLLLTLTILEIRLTPKIRVTPDSGYGVPEIIKGLSRMFLSMLKRISYGYI